MKRISIILLAGTAAIFMTACGGGSSDSGTTQPPATEPTPIPPPVTEPLPPEESVIYVSTTEELREALQKAVSIPGHDVIELREGVYMTTSDGLGVFDYENKNGNDIDAGIHIRGSSDHPGNVILDGANETTILKFVSLSKSTLKLSNLTIRNGYSDIEPDGVNMPGRIIDAPFSNIEIENCDIYNNTAYEVINGGVSTDTSIHKVTKVKIYDNKGSFYFGPNILLSNANIYNNSGYIASDGYSSGALGAAQVFNVRYQDNEYGLYARQVEQSIITGTDGVAVRGSHGVFIVNSLIANNVAGADGGFGTISSYNSIFYNNLEYDIDNHIDSIGTLVNSFADNDKIIGYSSIVNLYEGDPGFIDVNNGDYHLNSTSQLIDAGTNDIPSNIKYNTDIDGNPRIHGVSIDVGPYEYQ